MRTKRRLMKVDEDFRILVERISKQNKLNMVDTTKEIARTFNLMNGKKKIKKRILEEVSF